MTRIHKIIPTKKTDADVYRLVDDYLRKEGFTLEKYEDDNYSPLEPYCSFFPAARSAPSNKVATGEMVWRNGRGWITTPKFIKLEHVEGGVIIEGWGLANISPNFIWDYHGERVVGSTRMNRRLRELEEIIRDEE